MKKNIKNIIILLLMAAMLLAMYACINITELESFTIEYHVTVGGYIDGEKNQTIEKGKDGSEVTAVANDGYIFVNWSDGKTDSVRQEKNIQENISVTAYFEKETFTMIYTAAEGGCIDGDTEQTISYGENAREVTAVPYTGYDFTGWSDGIETETRHDKEIKQEIKVTAYFQKKIFEVKYYAGEGGKIDGNSSQTVAYGNGTTKVTAVPDYGYGFVKWSDNNSTDPIRLDSNVTENINATAEFEFVFEGFGGGNGSVENPFLIESYEHFLCIKLFPNHNFKLTSDLDLSGENHEPLFDNINMFNGVFDGNGHTISNMKIDTYSAHPSLFGYIYLGNIENLNIIDFEITVPNFNTSTGLLCVGAVAGESWGVIDNVYVKGIIRGNGLSYDGVAIGGLVGQAGNLLTNCRADMTIEINDVIRSGYMQYPFNVGGLVGVGFANFISCEAQGTISATQAHSDVTIGGLIGYFIIDESMDGSGIVFGKLDIKDCVTLVEILNGNGSYADSGGLIGSASVLGELKIENCAVYGDITNGGLIGGFICYITGYGASKITITDSHVKNYITINGGAAGFIFWITNNSASGGIFEVVNCYSEGNITANMAAGFCYMASNNIKFYRCYSASNIQSQAGTSGFIQQLMGGIVEECFSTGTIIVTYQAAGFIFLSPEGGYIKNCYSTSDIFVTNTDPDTEWRTLVSGFIQSANRGVIIVNCYYAGKISGHVYTSSSVSGLGSIVGDFAGVVTDTQIINCHLLYYDDTFAMDFIVESRTSDAIIDLTVYNSIAEMSSLADILNDGLAQPVWMDDENGLPQLIL